METIYRFFNEKLKAVLLFNDNELASLPVAHSVQLSETYENMKRLLETSFRADGRLHAVSLLSMPLGQ